MMTTSEPLLWIEDASSDLWLVRGDGRVTPIPQDLYDKGLDAMLSERPSMGLEFFARASEERRAPFEVMAFVKCPECDGRGFVECAVLFEHGEHGRSAIARYSEDMHEPLRGGQSVGPSVWDCEECGEGGMQLVYVQRRLTLGQLLGMNREVAA